MTREELEAGLKAGKTLLVPRRDAPELAIILELQEEGKVTTKVLQVDEQSSLLQVRWAGPREVTVRVR